MSNTAKIVVVGGGFAGFWAAAAARRVGGEQVDITLVSAGSTLQMRPRLYEAKPETLGVELTPLLRELDVTFVIDTATGLDLARNRVLLPHREISFDRVVIAVGSVMRRPNFVGLDDTYSIDTQTDAIRFDTHLAVLSKRPSPATVVVVGAGFTGVELALELRSRVEGHGGVENAERLRIVLVDRAEEIGPELGPNPRPIINEALHQERVEQRMNTMITSLVDGVLTFYDGSTMPADAVVLATGLQAAPFVSNIPGQRDLAGRILVDRNLRAPDAPQVFVTGDAAVADTGDGHASLQSCQHALQLGRYAGENAARDLLGLELVEYEQLRYVTCLDLGRAGAVFTTGWAREVTMSGDQAKALKRKINTELIYPPVDATRESLLQLSNVATHQ